MRIWGPVKVVCKCGGGGPNDSVLETCQLVPGDEARWTSIFANREAFKVLAYARASLRLLLFKSRRSTGVSHRVIIVVSPNIPERAIGRCRLVNMENACARRERETHTERRRSSDRKWRSSEMLRDAM